MNAAWEERGEDRGCYGHQSRHHGTWYRTFALACVNLVRFNILAPRLGLEHDDSDQC